MTTYVLRDGQLIEKRHAPPVNAGPYIQSDIAAYKSPCGDYMVEGRRERREDLKRNGCREVDPSEFKATYTNPEFCRRRGIQYEG